MAKILLVKKDNNLYYDANQEDFRTLAIQLHKDQYYDIFPYAYHLAMVEDCLITHNYTGYEYRSAAWLHDILEDQGDKTTFEELVSLFGERTALIVDACTGIGSNRKERNQRIYDKIRETPYAAPVKVADRMANMKYGLVTKNPKVRMYLKEFGEFSQNIRPIMTETRQGSIMWNKLEDIVAIGLKMDAEGQLAKVPD